MGEAKKGDVVKVHYTGKLSDGEQFDSSAGRDPLEFTVGAGQMIAGFDAALPGMKIGDRKTVNIPAKDGYGETDESAIIEFPVENVPADMKLAIGQKMNLSDEHGNPFPVVVKEIREDFVILDANHFLAGKDLVFDIELIEIEITATDD